MRKEVKLAKCCLKVELTEQEKGERAHRATELIDEYRIKEAHLENIKAEFRAAMKPMMIEMQRLAVAHKTGFEERTIENEAVTVFDTDEDKTWIEYNWKRYHERQMTAEERTKATQRELFAAREPTAEGDQPPRCGDELAAVIHEEQTVKTKKEYTA